jgi:putative hydrolase of the HAD superfamily
MFRAVIFDIDDTLQDWQAAIDRAVQDVLVGLAPELRAGAPERLQRVIASRYFVVRDGCVVHREHWRLLFESAAVWKAALPELEAGGADEIARRFQERLGAAVYPDARPALETLRAAFMLATLSNNPYSEDWLGRLGLREFFQAVVPALEGYRKPSPEAFRLVCDELAVAPRDALYVGDSITHDVEGALGAGLTPVWVDRHGGAECALPPGAHRIETLSELARLLSDLGRS